VIPYGKCHSVAVRWSSMNSYTSFAFTFTVLQLHSCYITVNSASLLVAGAEPEAVQATVDPQRSSLSVNVPQHDADHPVVGTYSQPHSEVLPVSFFIDCFITT